MIQPARLVEARQMVRDDGMQSDLRARFRTVVHYVLDTWQPFLFVWEEALIPAFGESLNCG